MMHGLRSFLTLVLLSIPLTAQVAELPERAEIEDEYKWNLEAMYPSEEAWEADFAKLESLLPELGRYKGRLGESGEVLLEALKFGEEVNLLAGNLYVYAGLKRDEDQRVSKHVGMFSRVSSLLSRLGEESAYFTPELLAMSDEQLFGMVDETPALELYRFSLEQTVRDRPHVLSEEQERLVAVMSDAMRNHTSVFNALDNADLSFGTMRDEDGNEVELTKARYGQFVFSSDRRVREEAWKGLFEVYEDYGNTLAANMEGHVKGRVAFSRARNYESALHGSLFGNAIPVDVYHNLITTLREGTAPLQRYLSIKKQALGVDTLQIWDLYAPMFEPIAEDIPFEEAKEIVADGLSVFGDDYLALYYRGFDERWVDVFENRGKRGGAYHWGTYTSLPYMLMNYNGTLTDVFTIAHEYGHSLHRWMTNATQPYTYSGTVIFVAEVASMTNEALLIQKMLREAETVDEKKALLEFYLDRFRGAFYRQASFADFELQMYEMAERGEPLTKESLNQLYADVFRTYYGDAVEAHALNASEWSRIPHFMRSDNFYVYQYATSFAAATALAKRILDGGEPAAEQFLELLRSGSNDYPIELLKKAGVDMTTPQPIIDTIEVFEQMVAELESLM